MGRTDVNAVEGFAMTKIRVVLSNELSRIININKMFDNITASDIRKQIVGNYIIIGWCKADTE